MNPGDTIGHYRIIGLLGKGGMGEVYAAEDPKLHRTVALKLLPAALAADPERRKRFEREAQAVAALNHPNIVTIYSVEESGGVPFLTMELVEGKSLKHAMEKSGAPTDSLLRMALAMSEALAAAHQRGIIHRDLKPGNVMVTPDGRIKILDFGLAKLHEAEASGAAEAPTRMVREDLTGEGRIVGTAAYMSPEQAEGKSVDQRSDIFSLGVMLHEMATGERPFKGDTDISIISAILKDTPTSVTDSRPDLPAALARIVKRCLAKDPLRRYQSARDLHIDLDELKQDVDSGIAAAPSRSSVGLPVVPSRSRLSRPSVYVAGGLGILALGAIAWWLIVGRRPVEPKLFAPDRFTRLTDSGTAFLAALSPDGRYVAHVKVEGGLPGLWVRQTSARSDVRVVPPSDARIDGIAFSPDGTFVYFNTYPRNSGVATLYKVPVLGGSPARVLEDVDSAVSFSPDGDRFTFMRGQPSKNLVSLMVASADGSGARQLADAAAPAGFLAETAPWSPDGRTIVVLERTTNQGLTAMRLAAVDAATGRVMSFGGDWDFISGIDWMPDGRSILLTGAGRQAQAHLWQVTFPSGERHRITSGGNEYRGVSLSRDGKTLATIEGEGHSNIWIHPVAGGTGRQITSSIRGVLGGGGVAWATDGRLVYTSAADGENNQLWIMDADGSHASQLTTSKGFAALPQISVDGHFVYYNGGDDRSFIWKILLDGGEPKRISPGPTDFRALPSPDGKWVFYTSSQDDGRNAVMKVASDGGTPVQVTKPETGFRASAVSPDGSRLLGTAWNAARRRPDRAFVSVTDGTLSWSDDVPPGARWFPDGKTWLYGDLRKGVAGIFARPVSGGPERKIVDLGEHQAWGIAISRDGRNLAVVRGRSTNDVVLSIARNPESK